MDSWYFRPSTSALPARPAARPYLLQPPRRALSDRPGRWRSRGAVSISRDCSWHRPRRVSPSREIGRSWGDSLSCSRVSLAPGTRPFPLARAQLRNRPLPPLCSSRLSAVAGFTAFKPPVVAPGNASAASALDRFYCVCGRSGMNH